MNYRASPGMISSLVISSELHRDYQRLSMIVDLLISMSAMRLLVCRYSSHIREAPDICLQRQSECYLHPGWKGPRFLHRRHRNRTKVRSLCMMRGLQVSHQVNERHNSLSFMMMRQIQKLQMESLERSSRRSNQ